MAALAVAITALRSEGRPVRVDAIGGASAGSFVAVLFAHGLLTGRDTAGLLRTAWVEEVDIELLRSGGREAPLTTDDLRHRIRSFVADTDRHPRGAYSPLDSGIEIQIGLTSLLGFEAPIQTSGGELPGLSFVDWTATVLQPEHEFDALIGQSGTSLLDAMLASAAHPLGFRPRQLDRSDERSTYERRGITNFPADGALWYTDGALVESAPVGRILAAARRAGGLDGQGGDGKRLHLVIDPRSSAPTTGDPWAAGGSPDWLDGLRRAASIVPTQALHDDLRRVATVNQRLRQLDELVDRLDTEFDRHEPVDDDDRRARREQWRGELAAIGGLTDKEPIDLEVISPHILAEDDDDHGVDLLTGDFIATFGGFLDASIRRSDFALGWRCTQRWVQSGLHRHGVTPSTVEAVLAAIEEAEPPDHDEPSRDHAGVARPPDRRPVAAHAVGRPVRPGAAGTGRPDGPSTPRPAALAPPKVIARPRPLLRR